MTQPERPAAAPARLTTPEGSGRDLGEHPLTVEPVFAGKLLDVHRATVREPDGRTGVREFLRHPGAVAVVALQDDGSVLLERQYRYPLDRHFVELPAGKRDGGEDPLLCGQRELLEETGYRAARWAYLGSVNNAIAYADERIDLFLARGLVHEGAQLDAGEHLDVLHVPWREALLWARDGTITDVKTIIGLHWLEKVLTDGWQPPGLDALARLDARDRLAKARSAG